MGTAVKLLSAACYLLSTPCNILNHSPPPISCAENKKCRVDCTCACGKCVPFRRHSFRSVSYLNPNQHYILPSLQAYTSAPHSLGEILISIPQATFIPFSPKLFSNAIPMVYFISCGVFAPIKNYKSIAIKK
jgi:hypothetical protein